MEMENKSPHQESQDDEKGDENPTRGNWSSKIEFFLSMVGYCVGLGNVWRFPFQAYKNGGGSFIIPYAIMLATAGMPLFFMEMSLGQFASQGPITLWNCVPFFRGLGYGMIIISGLITIYYNMIIAYTLYYIFASFTSELPWQRCFESWKPEWGCKPRDANETSWNITANWCRERNDTESEDFKVNCTAYISPKSPSQVYWEHIVLDRTDRIDDGSSEFKWQLVLCLLLAWIIVFLCLIRGIKSSGKAELDFFRSLRSQSKAESSNHVVVYVTATFPYIILVILLIRNATLEGALQGIEFYIIPDWERLKDAKVWHAAATQIFYSLGMAMGGLEVMASYNRFHSSVYRDSVMIPLINCGTSVFAGFVIFSVIGHMSFKNNVDIKDVTDGGPGLAFIAYPEGIALMPVPQLWSILFFIMLMTLGIDSQFVMMETVICAIVDLFPALNRPLRKALFTLALCVGFFLIGLPQCSRSGIYVMNLFDSYSASFSIVVISLLEVIAVIYVYGFKRFIEDIEMMVGKKRPALWIYWLATWIVITPCMLAFILIYSSISHKAVEYGDYKYPNWADGMGWLMVVSAVVPIPILAAYEYLRRYRTYGMKEAVRQVFSPIDTWGPALDKHRTGRYSPIGDSRLSNGDAQPDFVGSSGPVPEYGSSPVVGTGYINRGFD